MRPRHLIELIIFSAVVFACGFLTDQTVGPYQQVIIASCLINIILATSLNLVNGFTGQFSLGHAGFMAVGAYTAAAVTTIAFPKLGIPVNEITFVMALIAAGIVSSIAGIIVGIPSLRLKGDYLAIVTLGFGEIIRISILNIDAIGGARGYINIPLLSNFYWLYGVTLFTCVFLYRLLKSVPGKQFMAVRDDETATLAMGLSTTQVKVRSFLFSAFFAGLAGGLFAHYETYLNPATFNFNYSFQIVAMVVLGGMGSLSGSIVAAVLLTGLLEVLRPLQELTRLDFRMVIYSLVLILLMLTRPQGIFGRQELWESFMPRKWREKKAVLS